MAAVLRGLGACAAPAFVERTAFLCNAYTEALALALQVSGSRVLRLHSGGGYEVASL